MNSNQTVLDLNSVAYANGYWKSNHGSVRKYKPNKPTAFGSEFNPTDYAGYHVDYPKETMMERAVRLDILDTWTFVEVLQLRNSHSLEYTGRKGKAMQQAFNTKVFGR